MPRKNKREPDMSEAMVSIRRDGTLIASTIRNQLFGSPILRSDLVAFGAVIRPQHGNLCSLASSPACIKPEVSPCLPFAQESAVSCHKFMCPWSPPLR